jgi:hypothetical protein
LLRPRNRLWSGLVAGHRDHLEVLVELDVVLPVLALGVIDFKAAAASVSFSILPSVQPGTSRAALIFSASAGVTGVSASAKVLLANAAAKSPVVLRMIECHTWLKSAFGANGRVAPEAGRSVIAHSANDRLRGQSVDQGT